MLVLMSSLIFLIPNLALAHLLPKRPGEARLDRQVRQLVHARGATVFLNKRRPFVAASPARTNLRWHRHAERWLTRELAEDWAGSVRLIHLYIGATEATWLWNCSLSEGGTGAWVWNRQSSGAGGQLQFLRSTWERMFPPGLRIARRAGLHVPPRTRSYFHPFGQAIAGVYGSRYARHEWHGATC